MSENSIPLPWSQPVAGLPGFAHYYSTVDGVRLHYVRGGQTQGETIVLLAGFPQSGFARHKVMALLADRYDIIALDLPGGATPISHSLATIPSRWPVRFLGWCRHLGSQDITWPPTM